MTDAVDVDFDIWNVDHVWQFGGNTLGGGKENRCFIRGLGWFQKVSLAAGSRDHPSVVSGTAN